MTAYIETEALLKAMADMEANSGGRRNTEATDQYLVENFYPNELRKLRLAAELLAERCWKVRHEVKNKFEREHKEARP